jgi:hypothetical protein
MISDFIYMEIFPYNLPPKQQNTRRTLTVGGLCDASMYTAKAVLLPQSTCHALILYCDLARKSSP